MERPKKKDKPKEKEREKPKHESKQKEKESSEPKEEYNLLGESNLVYNQEFEDSSGDETFENFGEKEKTVKTSKNMK